MEITIAKSSACLPALICVVITYPVPYTILDKEDCVIIVFKEDISIAKLYQLSFLHSQMTDVLERVIAVEGDKLLRFVTK